MATLTDVTTRPSSGLNHIDALLDRGPGWNWVTPARTTLYYTFSLVGGNPSDVGTVLSNSPVAFNAAQQAAAVAVLNILSQITGIAFAAVADGNAADIHFSAADITSASSSGFCSSKWNYSFSGQTITSYVADAYVYLDNVEFAAGNNNPTPGTTGYEVLLHELGHALGLKHPFEDGVTLPAGQDNTSYTLMSYNHSGGPYATYSPYDVAALKFLYGDDGLLGSQGQGTTGLYLVGTANADTLNGAAGNDVLEGGAGNDALDGGSGADTAVYSAARALYTITPVGANFTISGPDGTDSLTAIENARFSDQTVVLSTLSPNSPPTGGISVTGTAQQGSVLGVASTLADADGLGAFSYRWQASTDNVNWSDVAGATSATFVPAQAQVGQRLRVVIRYVDGHGTEESATSPGTTPVANANDAPTGAVTISGSVQQNQQLTVSHNLADVDGLGTVTYQWQSSGDGVNWGEIAGAVDTYLVPGESLVGLRLRVAASYVDGQGTRELVYSNATVPLLNVNDLPSGAVSWAGFESQGRTLSVSNNLSDPDGLGSVSYQWQTSPDGNVWTAISGATGTSLVLQEAQVGLHVRVLASYVDGHGTAEAVASGFTARIANINDAPTGSVTLGGNATQGQLLSATHTLADPDGLGPIAFEWQSSANGSTWSPIAGATAASFQLGTAQVGQQIRVVARWTDGHGTAEAVASSATAMVLGEQIGTAGADALVGTAFADRLDGAAGNDRLTGAGGNDTLIGGSGLDTAIYALARANYAIAHNETALSVTALAGDEGHDALQGVERLQFSDLSLAFDLDGNAGTVARFLGAVFGPSSVTVTRYVGIGVGLADGGMSKESLMQLALEERLGKGFTAEAEVKLLYTNLLGVAPSSADLAYWVGQLNSGQYTAVSLALLAAGLDLNATNINLVGLAESGLGYT